MDPSAPAGTASRRAQTAASIALLFTVGLAVAKIAVWAATSSLAVLSQAVDSIVDVVALGIVFFGVRIAAKPADESHHYGHAKAENLVAFAQTLLLGAITIGIVVEAVSRLWDSPEPVAAPWYAFALLGGSAAIDAVRVAWLLAISRAERSDALRAGALNLATDIGTAVVALISLVLVGRGFDRADSVGAILVAAAVAVAAVRLGKRSVDVLMDRAPASPQTTIERAASAAAGVEEMRRVRIRTGGRQMFADVTVAAGRTASLERAHDIAENVEREIQRVAPGTDVVVHVEPVAETSGMVERVQAAASRIEGVREVHNVLVHAFNDGGRSKLHVTLHAKVEGGISVAGAHELSDRIEAAVAREIGDDLRVDTHIEPLRTTELGSDVTDARDDIVQAVTAAALQEADVIDCHEVVVTSSGGNISVVAHVRGRADLPLERIHDASERIEQAVVAHHPEVRSVLIHFEPA